MKKIYLTLAAAAVSGGAAFSQFAQPQINFEVNGVENTIASPNEGPVRAPGAVVWSDNFDDPNTWVIDNDGQSGTAMGWDINGTSDGWYSASGISSTSGGNFAELGNGTDPNAPTLDVVYTMTTANPIDIQTLAGSDRATLSFEQYGARFNDLQEVQISTDGTNFTTIGDNLGFDVLSQSGGSAYPNPDTKVIDLSPHIAGNASSVWIRFSWTTNYPASATNPNVWITYGWYIDDVQISSSDDNNLVVKDSYWGTLGLNYVKIPSQPVTQAAPIDFSANVRNEGLNDLTGCMLNVDVNSGAFTGTSAGATIASMADDSLALSTQFTPTADGNYAFTWNVSSDSIDDSPADNDLVGNSFDLGGYVYQRDTDGTPGNGGGEDGAGSGNFAFEAGNLFDIFNDAVVKGVDVVIGGNSTAGTTIFGKIYESTASGWDFIADSPEYTLTNQDVNTNATITLELTTPPTLEAGKTYLAVVGCYDEFYYGVSGSSDPQTSFIMYPSPGGSGGQYYTTNTPMVRMNFDPTIGVEEVETNGFVLNQNVPNPANNTSMISFELRNPAAVSFEMTDVTGKVVKTMNLGTMNAGAQQLNVDVAELSNGIYYYSVVAGDVKMTKKMTVKK